MLRVLLWHAGSLPKNYAHFLDYTVERIFLRKIGGGYTFIHRQLLEYFALQVSEIKHVRLVKPDAKDATIYHNLGEIYAEFGDYDQAIVNYTRATELDPKEVSVYRDRGLAYAQRKEYQRAIADYTSAIELDPKNTWTYHQRGIVYHELEEYEKAIADLTQVIKLDPKRAFLYRDRARVYRLNKEYEKALTDYTKATELAPQTAEFYQERGLVYADLNEYEKAIANLTRAIELQPSRVKLYYSRGSIFLHLKAFEQAIADFTCAIELDATYRGAYFQRGYAYLWLKKSKSARADFGQYAALTPDSVRAAWMVIYSSLGKQRPGLEIIEALEKVIGIAPQSGTAQICQGVALGLRSSYNNSIAQLERLLQFVRSVEDAYFWKGLFHAYLGQEAEATQAIMQALEAGLPPVLLTPLCWLEQERPEMYQAVAVPFLVQYSV